VPGASFTKVWRLRNVGTCAWTTAYSIIFTGGDRMGSPDVIQLGSQVEPGQLIDLAVGLVAPTTPGNYRGNWMLRAPTGQLFGITSTHNQPFWADVDVAGLPQVDKVFDFVDSACTAQWFSGAGGLPCPGTDGDRSGFVLKLTNPRLENGAVYTGPGLLTFPENVPTGYIRGIYPSFKVQEGDRFQAIVNCARNASGCWVLFRLDYQTGSGLIRDFWAFGEHYEGQYYTVDLDLTPLAGQDVRFVFSVLSLGSPSGDRAVWIEPRIVRTIFVPVASPTPRPTQTP
jgi:hypothetical protein